MDTFLPGTHHDVTFLESMLRYTLPPSSSYDDDEPVSAHSSDPDLYE